MRLERERNSIEHIDSLIEKLRELLIEKNKKLDFLIMAERHLTPTEEDLVESKRLKEEISDFQIEIRKLTDEKTKLGR